MPNVYWMLIVLLMICMSPAYAHEPMAHNCSAPVRPVDDSNDRLWAEFLAEIDGFQACVNAAMQRHEAAAREHQAQARAAVDLWNTFVTTSLNAPEDFPWPPAERDVP
ncbi:MAG: hypothetical protein NXH95_05510 [Pseudomonadaceae bacterium]|nr:hypothetical protein [Pseudomonadaceae bacterium]